MNTARTDLYTVLPLDTPYSLHIFPIYMCNFKCSYCIHSLPSSKLKEIGFKKQKMSFDLYKKSIDDLSEFPKKLKALIFAGHGEPLLHPDIVKMVKYAKEKSVAERVEIVTNGSLLTKEMSDGLISAGLDRLRVSLQGITSEKYMDVSSVKIDMTEFVNQLKYFYTHKKNTEVYVKIMDISMDSHDDFQKFREMFSCAADITNIEYAIPFVNEVDYSKYGELSHKCKQGNTRSSKICSMPYYMLVLCPDGSVVPCCSTSIPIIFGNAADESLYNIWNSSRRNNYLIRMLNGVQDITVCNKCNVPAFGLQEGDYLDGHEDMLADKYKNRQQYKLYSEGGVSQ